MRGQAPKRPASANAQENSVHQAITQLEKWKKKMKIALKNEPYSYLRFRTFRKKTVSK